MNVLAPNGDTPLHLTMKLPEESQCLIITKLLVEAGCSPGESDADDKPPVHIAVVRGFITVVEYLLSQDAPLPSRILFAALHVTLLKRVAMIRLLITKGANVHVLSPDGHSLLHVAMRSPDRSVFLEIAQIFIDAGYKPSNLSQCDETLPRIVTDQQYHEVSVYLLLSATSADISSLLSPKPSIQAAALRSLVGNVNGLCLKPIEECKLLKVISQCLDDEDQHLAVAKKILVTRGDPCFDSAVRRGFYRVVQYLLSQRVALPHTILFTALRHQVPMVPLFIHKGADVHATEPGGDTLLHVAMSIPEELQCQVAVQALIQAGCQTSTSNAAGKRPIHTAVSRGFISVVKCLLSCTPRDELPSDLLSSLAPRHSSLPMVRLLVDHGADVSHVDDNGNGLLHHVMRISDEEECLEATQVLIYAGYRHFARNTSKRTPLHAAVMRGFVSVADCLISHDMPLPLNILDFTLRRWFVRKLDPHKLKVALSLFICKGANVHVRSTNRDTLLHCAMGVCPETQRLEVIKLLVEAGCSPCVPNAGGELPIQVAVYMNMYSVVEYLLSQNVACPPDILLTALNARHGSSQVFRMMSLLVRNGADVSLCAANGDSVLHVALARYISCNLRDGSLLEVVKILVQAGCDPDARNSTGQTPLEVAATGKYSEVEDYLRGHVLEQPPLSGPSSPAASSSARRGLPCTLPGSLVP